MRKLLVAPVIAFGAVALTGSTAFAHECYNASRSAKGNEGASNSRAWATISLADLYADAVENSEEFKLPPADESDIAAMVADAAARGVPGSFLIHLPSTAASGVYGSAKSSDGKGIDHFFAHYGGDIVAAYLCGAGAGPCATV
ncbi:MAG TPA: hypothetical protein VJS45_06410 [Acidimicrobiia bacterium]|nr:hypothetical protein [Acidimicrobiia bacterium]